MNYNCQYSCPALVPQTLALAWSVTRFNGQSTTFAVPVLDLSFKNTL